MLLLCKEPLVITWLFMTTCDLHILHLYALNYKPTISIIASMWSYTEDLSSAKFWPNN